MDNHIVAPWYALPLREAETTIRSLLLREEPRYMSFKATTRPTRQMTVVMAQVMWDS